jgi:hypothetical protein
MSDLLLWYAFGFSLVLFMPVTLLWFGQDDDCGSEI